MTEIVENFDNKDPCEAFTGAMEFLRSEGYLTYQYNTFRRQLYSIVILTEKGLAASEAIPVSFKENRNNPDKVFYGNCRYGDQSRITSFGLSPKIEKDLVT